MYKGGFNFGDFLSNNQSSPRPLSIPFLIPLRHLEYVHDYLVVNFPTSLDDSRTCSDILRILKYKVNIIENVPLHETVCSLDSEKDKRPQDEK